MAAIHQMILSSRPAEFPIIKSALGTDFDTAATSNVVSLPSGNDGELLVVWYSAAGIQTITETTGGWTKHSEASQSNNHTGALFYKIATGSDTFTSSHGSVKAAAIVYRISLATSTVDSTNANSTATTSWNPPSVTSSAGVVKKYLALVFIASSTSTTYVPSSGYTNDVAVTTGSLPHVYSAYRNAEVITEDPAASTNVNANYNIFTVLIHPSA